MGLNEYAADQDLREAHRRTLRQLEQEKRKTRELVEAVYQAASDSARGLSFEPVKAPKRDLRERTGEVAMPLVSDLQLGKVTPSYNTDQCRENMERYADRLLEKVDMQRADHPVREAHILALGDMVEGELIFPHQPYQLDRSLYAQVTTEGPRIVGDFIRRMLASFDKVHVTWVIGNHGQIGGPMRRFHNPETNADRMLGRILATIFADEKRLTWTIPDGDGERSWYAIDRVGSQSFLCFHGDQVRGGGFGGVPFYGFQKAINGWAAGAIPEPFDYAVCGHWHQATKLTYNKRKLWVNGSTESYNVFAQEELKAMGDPAQVLLFCHPDRGVTAEYEIDLT